MWYGGGFVSVCVINDSLGIDPSDEMEIEMGESGPLWYRPRTFPVQTQHKTCNIR